MELSGVAGDAEGLSDQVRRRDGAQFSREFEKVAMEQRRSASEELEDKNQRSMQQRLEASKKKEAKLALKNKQLQVRASNLPLPCDLQVFSDRLLAIPGRRSWS